ncbi:TPA: hypothetical protein HA265_03865 [Candidatus Woesearchaeota archaeon]|nr:hypothetical protein [Candidatus Woesearchaeota archaeon]
MEEGLLLSAGQEASRIAVACPGIDVIVLDQWRRDRADDEWLVSYLGDHLASCDDSCGSCPVYAASGGEDDPSSPSRLVTTLVRATSADLQNYDGAQRFLNCKSPAQYLRSFVNCFVGECHDRHSMLDELDYVVKFHVLFWRGHSDPAKKGRAYKKDIIDSVASAYSPGLRSLFLECVDSLQKKHGFL